MRRLLLAIFLMGAAVPAGAQQVLGLSCMDALIAAGRAELAGVFSFIPEKDSAAAFADLLVHNKDAMKKYLGRVESDLKVAGGINVWDHETIVLVAQIYASPMAETLLKPAAKTTAKLSELTLAPTLPLDQLTARRKR